MSGVLLKLEGFAGASIDETLTSAVQVSQRVGCWVEINVNGLDVLISPSDLPRHILDNYEKARERGRLSRRLRCDGLTTAPGTSGRTGSALTNPTISTTPCSTPPPPLLHRRTSPDERCLFNLRQLSRTP